MPIIADPTPYNRALPAASPTPSPTQYRHHQTTSTSTEPAYYGSPVADEFQPGLSGSSRISPREPVSPSSVRSTSPSNLDQVPRSLARRPGQRDLLRSTTITSPTLPATHSPLPLGPSSLSFPPSYDYPAEASTSSRHVRTRSQESLHSPADPGDLEASRLRAGETAGGRKRRSRATQEQLDLLNSVYQRTPFPSTVERAELAQTLGMTPRSVQIWCLSFPILAFP